MLVILVDMLGRVFGGKKWEEKSFYDYYSEYFEAKEPERDEFGRTANDIDLFAHFAGLVERGKQNG